mgnify:CR=1 FL=1|jgi:hypothetical protein|tara:strand:+ start:585 stop:818 length:234 start_codon:yes stop_codon:yes gene_type:complete
MNSFETSRISIVTDAAKNKTCYVVLECETFELAVDAIEKVERGFNGQLSPATYEPIGHSNSQDKAFIIKISHQGEGS